MSVPYLLWAGPIVKPEIGMRRRAVSPAGNGWQLALVRHLSERVPMVLLGHAPERLWPRGALHVRADAELPDDLAGELVAYANIPAVRARSLTRGYAAGLARTIARRGPPAALLTYNDAAWNVAVGRLAQRRNIPWICVVADAAGGGRELDAHCRRIAPADGCVFLSWGRYRDWQGTPRLHLDGGVDALCFDPAQPAVPPRSPRVVLYAGAMGAVGGAAQLVAAFRHVRSTDVELWICGHGDAHAIERASAGDARVRILGLLSADRLHQTLARADVFVNPRPPELEENRSNFPSKVLEYLRWGRPVVSTWTDGLAPAYRDVLHVVAGDAPEVLAAAIDRALAVDDVVRARRAAAIARFLGGQLWSLQAGRLLDWLATDVGLRAQLGAPVRTAAPADPTVPAHAWTDHA